MADLSLTQLHSQLWQENMYWHVQPQLGWFTGSSSPGRRPYQPIHSHKHRCCKPGHSWAYLSMPQRPIAPYQKVNWVCMQGGCSCQEGS